MDAEEALRDAKAVLEKRAEKEFTVIIDRPSAVKPIVNAFKKLGCKVKLDKEGVRLKIVRPTV